MHRSRVCQFVIDVPDLDQGVAFWTAALDADEEGTFEASRQIYRRIRLPDSEIRILLQKPTTARNRKSACISIWKLTMSKRKSNG
jgi:hypothetical protein